MATEKKLKDPAEAALSAIEQALNLDAFAPGPDASRVEPRLPDVGDADPLHDPSGRLAPPRLDLDQPLASDLPPPDRTRPRRAFSRLLGPRLERLLGQESSAT